jgi:hypothetical protein
MSTIAAVLLGVIIGEPIARLLLRCLQREGMAMRGCWWDEPVLVLGCMSMLGLLLWLLSLWN